MIFFPTRGRSWALERFIENYHKTKATLSVMVIIDADNETAYVEAIKKMPSHWCLYINPHSHDLVKALNGAYEKLPDEDVYGIVPDDVIPYTDNWDTILSAAAKEHGMVWPDDGIWGAKRGKMELPTHPFIDGKLVRAWGWFSPPYTNRHCSDFIWRDFAQALNIGKPCPDVLMEHKHWHIDASLYDATYATQPSTIEADKQYHQIYKGSAQFKEDVQRVKEKLGL